MDGRELCGATFLSCQWNGSDPYFGWVHFHTMKALSLAVATFFAMIARGQADQLDPTFAGVGYMVTPLPQFGEECANAVTAQQDHKILVAGFNLDWEDPRALLIRYTADGMLDGSFADGGVWSAPTIINNGLNAVIAGPGGAITAFGTNGSGNIYMVRFTGDGVLDNSFGNGGELSIDLGGQEGPSCAIKTTDGGFMLSGVRDSTGFLLKLAFDGSIDGSFGQNGIAFSSCSAPCGYRKVIRDLEGNYVACGTVFPSPDLRNVLVERFAQNGTPDPGFGAGGLVELPFNGLATGATDVYAHADGRVVVVGYGWTTPENDGDHTVIARFLSDGTPDPGFSDNGRRIISVPGMTSIATDVYFRWDGMYIVVGWSIPIISFPVNTWITRLDIDGETDTTFGTDGNVHENYGQGQFGPGFSPCVTMDPAGRVVVATTGIATQGGIWQILLARYLKDPFTAVGTQVSEPEGLHVFPSPFEQDIYADLPASFVGDVGWELCDALGSPVLKGISPNGATNGGRLRVSIPSSLAAGCYILRLLCSGQERALRVIRE